MKASLGVLALSISLTRTGPSFKALILVNTLMGALVVGVSAFTVTPETAQEVHAGAVLTDVRHHLALVDLLQIAGQWVHYLTRSPTTTKSSVFCTTLKYRVIPLLCNVLNLIWTRRAFIAPASPHGTAAYEPRLRMRHW